MNLRICARSQHGVPVTEDPRSALHATIEVDQEIPAEHYRAVAEVIRFVLRLKWQVRMSRVYAPF